MNTKMTKFLMTALLALGVSGAWAGVAQIGETKYETVAAAVAAAKSGDTVKLLVDAVETQPIDVGKNIAITLDLNGMELTNSANVAVWLGEGSNLTISNGNLIAINNGITANGINATATIATDAYVEVDREWVKGENHWVMNSNGKANTTFNVYGEAYCNGFPTIQLQSSNSTVNLDGAYVESWDWTAVYVNGSYGGNTVNIKDSEIWGWQKGVYVSNIYGAQFQTLNISGDTEISGRTAVEVKHTNVTIGEGVKLIQINEINGYEPEFEEWDNGPCTYGWSFATTRNGENDKPTGTITVTGGEFTGPFGIPSEIENADEEVSVSVTGGIYDTDPSAYVAEGYEAVAQGTTPETWKVVRPTPPEVEVTVPETIPVKDAEGNAVSAEAEAAAGEVVAQVKQDIASNKIPAQHTGTGVKAIENTSAIVAALQGQADAFDAGAQVTEESSINKYVDVEVKETKVNVSGATATFASIVFDVTPKAEITIISAVEGSAGEEKTLTTTVPNSEITQPITFRLPLPNYFTVSAIVKHAGDPDRLLPVKGAEGGKYVEVTVTHFSEFEVEPSDEVSTTVSSSTVLGIKRRANVEAGTVAIGVPWLGMDGNAIAVQDLIAKDCLTVNDELHVWNGTTYEAWLWTGTEWMAFTSSTGATPKMTSLVRGKAAWLKRAAAGSIIQIGQYNEGAITTTPEKGASLFKAKHSLLINPKSQETSLSQIAGAEGDQIVILTSPKVRLECVGGQWGTTKNVFNPTTFVTEKQFTKYTDPIPADTGFWYISAGGAPVIQW